eukprot:SAG11_NODE_1001_length_6220_cov_6.550400_3_plen_267_part_00
MEDVPRIVSQLKRDLNSSQCDSRLPWWSCFLGYVEAYCTCVAQPHHRAVVPGDAEEMATRLSKEFKALVATHCRFTPRVEQGQERQEGQALAQARATLRRCADWVWRTVRTPTAQRRDEPHTQSLYALMQVGSHPCLTITAASNNHHRSPASLSLPLPLSASRVQGKASSINCLGAALAVTLAQRQLATASAGRGCAEGVRAALALTEDHAFIALPQRRARGADAGRGGGWHFAEVAWPCIADASKRGAPPPASAERCWLYMQVGR